MSATINVVTETPVRRGARLRPLLRAGAISGVAAAIATVLIAAIARAADVSLDVDGKAIPVAGFATMTLLGAILGVVLAVVVKLRGRFLVGCALLTAASIIPSISEPDHTSTKVVLVVAHLVAAAIIVPMLAMRLPARDDR